MFGLELPCMIADLGNLDRSRSAIMAVQVQSTDVFLCYQRLRVSCALCNNFQAARPRQTTERRLAPLYVEHMPSYIITGAHVHEVQLYGASAHAHV